jgi:hypothetical protein
MSFGLHITHIYWNSGEVREKHSKIYMESRKKNLLAEQSVFLSSTLFHIKASFENLLFFGFKW